MNAYIVTPKSGEPFEVQNQDVIGAMADAERQLGHDRYSIRRKDAVPAPLLGTVMPDGRIQL